jgi:aspartyl-tRNA(Asn)/glutamyl-tRNA(Gln) amidotransferase subunit A
LSELLEGSIAEAATALAKRQVSAQELVAAALERILEVQPRWNFALSIRSKRALEAAAAADAARARGEPTGALHGIPLMHKDMYYRAGETSTCGSRIREGFVPETTATVIRRLDQAGAIDLGRLNMAEFAVGLTGHNIHYGDCRNPWSPAHITGGSSSGAGSVTAPRCVFGALGSDTGGSVRVPASVNGVVGLKPTQGRVSRAGAMPLSPSLDCLGPLARTVEDCAWLFEVIAGEDPADSSASRRLVPAACTAAKQGAEEGLRDLRIGIPTSFFEDELDPDIQALMTASRETLADLGAELIEIDMPDMNRLATLQNILMGGEAAARHGPWLKAHFADYSPQVRARLLPGLVFGATAWQDAARLRPLLLKAFADAVFAKVDLLATPTMVIAPPTLDETRLGDGPEMTAMIATLGRCTRPINYLGLPALSLPMGLADNGVPAGLQLIGRPFDEALMFRAAGGFEQALGFTDQRPPHAALAKDAST